MSDKLVFEIPASDLKNLINDKSESIIFQIENLSANPRMIVASAMGKGIIDLSEGFVVLNPIGTVSGK